MILQASPFSLSIDDRISGGLYKNTSNGVLLGIGLYALDLDVSGHKLGDLETRVRCFVYFGTDLDGKVMIKCFLTLIVKV